LVRTSGAHGQGRPDFENGLLANFNGAKIHPTGLGDVLVPGCKRQPPRHPFGPCYGKQRWRRRAPEGLAVGLLAWLGVCERQEYAPSVIFTLHCQVSCWSMPPLSLPPALGCTPCGHRNPGHKRHPPPDQLWWRFWRPKCPVCTGKGC